MYVDSVLQGHGIGRAFLRELINEARGLGYRTIATDNRAGLQQHSKYGYKVVGTMRDAAHKFDRWAGITLVQLGFEARS